MYVTWNGLWSDQSGRPILYGRQLEGTSVNVNTFNASLVTGDVVLTYQAPGSCVLPVDITISVFRSTRTITFHCQCLRGRPRALDLTDLEDPSYTNGNWSGVGVSGSIFNPLNLAGINILLLPHPTIVYKATTTTVEVEETNPRT